MGVGRRKVEGGGILSDGKKRQGSGVWRRPMILPMPTMLLIIGLRGTR